MPESTPVAPTDLRQAIAQAARTVLDGTGPHTTDEWAALVADAVLAVVQPHFGTCDASLIGGIRHLTSFGPCVLRHGHDGPVHKDATGAQWYTPSAAVAEQADLRQAIAQALAVAEVIEANGIRWAADSIRRALGGTRPIA